MMALKTVLLGLLLAAAPVGSDIERPCMKGSREARQGELLLASVARAQQSLEEGAPTAPFLAALERMQRHRCFHWSAFLTPRIDEDTDPLVLREWWTAGGERWLRSLIEFRRGQRTVLFPPHLRKRLSGMNRTLLEPAACDAASTTCGDVWRERMARSVEAACSSCSQQPKSCPLPRDPSFRGLFDWLSCVDERSGFTLAWPIDPIAPPREGWLVIRHRRELGNFGACRVASAYALATGDAWQLDSCGRQTVRRGRVPVAALQELALFLVVADDLHFARTHALERTLPEGVSLSWSGTFGRIQGKSLHDGSFQGPFLPKISWRVRTTSGEKLGDMRSDGKGLVSEVASHWLRALDERLVPGCPSAALPDGLLARPDVGTTLAWERALERHTYQDLAKVIRNVPEGCATTASPVKPARSRPGEGS